MLHEGHRARMIEKLKDNDKLAEHELLEILLYNAIPRKNTNDQAHLLLLKFRTIANLFRAPMEEIASVDGIGKNTAAYIKLIGIFYERYQESRRYNRSDSGEPEVFSRDGSFGKYLQERYRNKNCEVVDLFFLDEEMHITGIKTFSNFSENQVVIDGKEFSKAVSETSAAAVVIAHNHPFCSCEPSSEDNQFTKKCMLLCSLTNVKLVDHFVIGENGTFSYHNSGFLHRMHEKLSLGNLLNEI